MHSGEILMARRLKMPHDPMDAHYHPQMPLQHQVFFSDLPYFIFGNLDEKDRPWVTIITGTPGFVTAANPNQLDVQVNICKWDPIVRNLQEANKAKADKPFPLFSGLGVDFSNRRRNKVAGVIQADSIDVSDIGNDKAKVLLRITTEESLGNCPKYINIRSVKYSPRDSPQLAYSSLELPKDFDGLPKESQETILQVDTMFIATRHHANPNDPTPISDMDVNIRGGPKGFVRVLPGAKQIVWPDYSGNRFYQSLGNIESDKKVGMVFPNFFTGDILYITGDAENLIGDDATDLMPSCQLVTVVTITGFVHVKGGLDLAQQTSAVSYSPYNPPIRFLKSESSLHPLARDTNAIPITLSQVTPITSNVSAFTFTLPAEHPVTFIPGQHVLIDFSKAKPKQYSHMNEARPQRLNDDFVRSWTISSIPPVDSSGSHFGLTTSLTCTIKLNEEGEITPFLYSFANYPPNQRPTLNITHRGVNGEFTVFDHPPTSSSPLTLANKHMVFIAGGIGITPLLTFHAAIQALHLEAHVSLLFSGRNDELLLASPFFSPSTTPSPSPSSPHPSPLVDSVKLFQTGADTAQGRTMPFGESHVHRRRMTKSDVAEALRGGNSEKTENSEKTVYLCGPVGFMDVAVKWLGELGVNPDNVKQEAFNF